MQIYQGRWLKTAEVWFYEQPTAVNVDAISYRQIAAPIQGAVCTEFFTITIDLSQTEIELLAAIKKDTRYEIRRAESKDHIVCEFCDVTPQILEDFCHFYNEFAAVKGLDSLDINYLQIMARNKRLSLSRAMASDQRDLVWHCYYCGTYRTRLLHSASVIHQSGDTVFRNMVGRVNRLLHWYDMMTFKARGFKTYDLGGWYPGDIDEQKIKINQFKEEFGGTLVKEYNCRQDISLRARLIQVVFKLLKRV